MFYIDKSDGKTKRLTVDSVFLREGRHLIVVPFDGTFNEFVKQYLKVQKKIEAARRRQARRR